MLFRSDAVLCDVNGGAGLKLVITGGERIPVSLFLFEVGIAKMRWVFEEYPECLRELVMLLNQRLIVYLFQKGRFLFVFGRGGDKVLVSFQVEPLLVGQHMVPDVTATAESVLEQFRLGLVGVKPDFEGGVLNRFPILGLFFRCSWHSGSLPIPKSVEADGSGRNALSVLLQKLYFL